MYQSILPPDGQQEPIRAPMIYVDKRLKWEYKLITRDLEKEKPLDETEFNGLGEDGWELAEVAQQPPLVLYYFKRPKED